MIRFYFGENCNSGSNSYFTIFLQFIVVRFLKCSEDGDFLMFFGELKVKRKSLRSSNNQDMCVGASSDWERGNKT